MSTYINTRTSIGEEETLTELVAHSLTEFIEDGVTAMRGYVFYGQTNLQTVVLPNATSLPSSAFDGCTSLSDASGINDWDINMVTNFNKIFRNAPVHPEFTKRAGTWDANGTFTPSA